MLPMMRNRSCLASFFKAIVGATLLLFSCAAFAWDTQAAMKKISEASPGSVPPEGKAPEGKTPAKETGSAAKSRAGPKTGAQYGVEFVPGGIDRVILTKRDDAKNVCVQVTLASPRLAEVQAPAGKIESPPNWSLESAIMVRDASGCGDTLPRCPERAIDATAVIGAVRCGCSPTGRTAVR